MSDPAVKHTERDYESVRQALIDRLKLRFPNDWPEFAQTTVAMAILDIVAWTHDQRAYYYDVQARNCFLETADLPEAVTALARQLGYQRRLATAASVPVTLSPQPPQAGAILIPKGQSVQIGDNLVFEAIESYIIPAGKPTWPGADSDEIITFVEGETRTEEFLSDGTAFQSFSLAHPKVIQGSITVSVLDEIWEETDSLIFIEGTGAGRDTFIGTGEGNQSFTLTLLHIFIDPNDEDVLIVMVDSVRWAQVEQFTGAPQEFRVTQDQDGITTLRFGAMADGAAPAENAIIDVIYQIAGAQRRYTVEFIGNDRAQITFGDGIGGVIPMTGATISVSYRTGGGVRGNISRGAINTNMRGILPSGAEVNVRVFNHESASGGEEVEDIERVKVLAPRYAKANSRAVRQEDWTTLALTYRDARYGAPAFAAARLKQRIPERNCVEIALWSRDEVGQIRPASTPLKQAIKSFLDTKRTICTYVNPVDGDILYFDIEADVQLRSGRTISSVLPQANEAIRRHFNSTFVAPGIDLSLALIIQKLLEVEHIDNTTLQAVKGSRLITLDLGQGDDGTTKYIDYFDLPIGQNIVPGSVEITAGDQVASDDGNGNLLGDIDATKDNTVDYSTGRFEVHFPDPPATEDYIDARARYYAIMLLDQRNTVNSVNRLDGVTDYAPVVSRRLVGWQDGISIDAYLPMMFLPYDPHHIVIIGGYDDNGTHPGGQLMAFDDGAGGVVGDVLPGGTVNYTTGEITFQWNATPPPGGYTDYWGYLLSAPDGSKTEFDFEVRDTPGGGGSKISLKTLDGEGRLKFVLSDLDTVNVSYDPGYDNGSGIVDSSSLNRHLTNEIRYEDPATLTSEGTINFHTAPEAASGRDFKIQLAPTALLLYTPFIIYLPGVSGYDKVVVVDDNGQLLRDAATAYPYSRLDYRTGRFICDLSSPSEAGRTAVVSYHSFIQSDCQDIPIEHVTMPTFSQLELTEINRPVNV